MRALTVIDRNTMQQKQQFTYATEAEEHHADIYEDFMVVRFSWEKFAVLKREADGTYCHEIFVDSTKYDDIMLADLYWHGDMVFDWNGEMLLMSDDKMNKEDDYYSQNCGFYLAAFDENGLQYYGEYESSLDTGKEYIDYYFNCMPMDVEPLSVKW